MAENSSSDPKSTAPTSHAAAMASVQIDQEEQFSGSGFKMPQIFDFSLVNQAKEGQETTDGRLYNYFWKKFDFRNGRNL